MLFAQPGHRKVIGHRGACGILPEQTIEAFELALRQGADAIELDVVPTRDGQLLVRHENELSATTNIADHSEFASRRTTKVIDGAALSGWFSEDFTIQELQFLRARQRFPFRDHAHDDRYGIPMLDAVLQWRLQQTAPPSIFIEIKHPTYFASVGLDPADLLVRTLADHRLTSRDCGIVAMSFETKILRDLRHRVRIPLVQLLDAPSSRPFDWKTSGRLHTYGDLLTPKGLAEIASYADGIGPWKRLIVPAKDPSVDGASESEIRLDYPTGLISEAHAAGLFVCSWTFRDEPQFLAADYGGDPTAEYRQFAQLGLDAVISDFPATAVRALAGSGTEKA